MALSASQSVEFAAEADSKTKDQMSRRFVIEATVLESACEFASASAEDSSGLGCA